MERTNSTRFVLPMLRNEKYTFFNLPSFENCYIGDSQKPVYTNHILLLYKYNTSVEDDFLKFRIKSFHNYVTNYVIDKHREMYVFEVPESLKEDYEVFKQGKYSEFSNTYKKQILDFHSVNNKSVLHGILYKKEPAIKYLAKTYHLDYDFIKNSDEYWFPPHETVEIYNNFFELKILND